MVLFSSAVAVWPELSSDFLALFCSWNVNLSYESNFCLNGRQSSSASRTDFFISFFNMVSLSREFLVTRGLKPVLPADFWGLAGEV